MLSALGASLIDRFNILVQKRREVAGRSATQDSMLALIGTGYFPNVKFTQFLVPNCSHICSYSHHGTFQRFDFLREHICLKWFVVCETEVCYGDVGC